MKVLRGERGGKEAHYWLSNTKLSNHRVVIGRSSLVSEGKGGQEGGLLLGGVDVES